MFTHVLSTLANQIHKISLLSKDPTHYFNTISTAAPLSIRLFSEETQRNQTLVMKCWMFYFWLFQTATFTYIPAYNCQVGLFIDTVKATSQYPIFRCTDCSSKYAVISSFTVVCHCNYRHNADGRESMGMCLNLFCLCSCSSSCSTFWAFCC